MTEEIKEPILWSVGYKLKNHSTILSPFFFDEEGYLWHVIIWENRIGGGGGVVGNDRDRCWACAYLGVGGSQFYMGCGIFLSFFL